MQLGWFWIKINLISITQEETKNQDGWSSIQQSRGYARKTRNPHRQLAGRKGPERLHWRRKVSCLCVNAIRTSLRPKNLKGDWVWHSDFNFKAASFAFTRVSMLCRYSILFWLILFALRRTVPREHIPKKHLDFENPIKGKNFDNTMVRIYGEANPQIMTTNNTEYGVARN